MRISMQNYCNYCHNRIKVERKTECHKYNTHINKAYKECELLTPFRVILNEKIKST